MRAVCEKKGIVIKDWYFGEGMESIDAGKKDVKRKDSLHFFDTQVYY